MMRCSGVSGKTYASQSLSGCLDAEANQLAFDLIARTELPLYIYVRGHIVLAGGGSDASVWHAHEALGCVK
jgi:hypothetical protein